MRNISMLNEASWKTEVSGKLLTLLMGCFFALGMSVFFTIGLVALVGQWGEAIIRSVTRHRNSRAQP